MLSVVILQGYPTELLPMMVSGVPSIHICVDFIPELLAQPQIEKQVLCVNYVHTGHDRLILNSFVYYECVPYLMSNVFWAVVKCNLSTLSCNTEF